MVSCDGWRLEQGPVVDSTVRLRPYGGLAGLVAEGLPQQALQLRDVEAMTANDTAVEKEDGDVESVATL